MGGAERRPVDPESHVPIQAVPQTAVQNISPAFIEKVSSSGLLYIYMYILNSIYIPSCEARGANYTIIDQIRVPLG